MKKNNIHFILAISFSFICFCAQQRSPDQPIGATGKHAGKKRTSGDAQLSSDVESSSEKIQKFDIDSKDYQEKVKELEHLFEDFFDQERSQIISGMSQEKIDQQISKMKGILQQIDLSEYLESGAGGPALEVSAQNPRLLELSKWLISKDADIKQVWGIDIIITATKHNNIQLVKYLITIGKDCINSWPCLELAIFPDSGMPKPDLIKLLLINGAKTNNLVRRELNRPVNSEQKQIYDEVVQEIVTEYQQKIQEHNQDVKEAFKVGQPNQILPPELVNIINQYLIPEYKTNQELLNNIVNIRYALNEMSPIQKEKFEREQQQKVQQQQQQAASAGSSSGGAVADSAAAASVAASTASQGGGGAAAMID